MNFNKSLRTHLKALSKCIFRCGVKYFCPHYQGVGVPSPRYAIRRAYWVLTYVGPSLCISQLGQAIPSKTAFPEHVLFVFSKMNSVCSRPSNDWKLRSSCWSSDQEIKSLTFIRFNWPPWVCTWWRNPNWAMSFVLEFVSYMLVCLFMLEWAIKEFKIFFYPGPSSNENVPNIAYDNRTGQLYEVHS